MYRCFQMLFLFLLALCPLSAAPGTYFVAPAGNDAWSGTLPAPNKAKSDGPFATLERARDEVRKWRAAGPLTRGGITILVRGGVYEMARPLELAAGDSGTPQAPIVYRAYGREEVRLVGGKVVTGWKPVTDATVLARLDESARGKVLQADLKAQGVTDLGEVTPDRDWTHSEPGLEIFFRGEPMTLARWPNEGTVKVVKALGPTPFVRHGSKGCNEGIFSYDGDRPRRWVGEKNVMLHGYWILDWADERQRVESIDTDRRVITLSKPDHTFGYRDGGSYYAYNLLCELDQPGEWYLDRETGMLYFWPPSSPQNGRMGESESGGKGAGRASNTPALQYSSTPAALVSVLPALIATKGASHVTFRGFTLEGSRGTAVTVSGGAGVQVIGCTIRNVGGWAVSASGAGHRVAGCDISQTAQGGISLNGGDRRALTPAGLVAENNHIHHYSRWKPVYRAGVALSGVGNRAAHNLIHNAPHMAIGFGGNDHVVEFNEIHSVVHHSNDAGAMYTGRDWSMRGQIIRYNYLHHIYGHEGRGCVGVYLDDQFSSAHITGNVFYRVPSAAFIGGGRDCTIDNNIFVECTPAIHVDARGLGWAANGKDTLVERLKSMPYQEEPWKSRFPQLLTLLDDPDAMAPEGNLIARNIQWGGKWDGIEGKARPFLTFQGNLLGEDPHFVDAEKHNFQLREDSPAYKMGFQRIPIEKIGLYASEERASWPVRHAVRPAPERLSATGQKVGASVCKAGRLAAAPAIDGVLAPGEWGKPEAALAIAQGIQGEKASPASRAWVAHDGTHLLIAVENTVDVIQPLRLGDDWGQNDAVEIAMRNPAVAGAPPLVLRGLAGGAVAGSEEAGASAAATKKATDGVRYAAKVVGPALWTAEFRIPFAALGIGPARPARFPFNLSVRKTANDLWLMWRGTHASTWDVDNAGVLVLE